MRTDSPHIVIDNGGGEIKAGLNRDSGPSCVFPTVGRKSSTDKTCYVGFNSPDGFFHEVLPIERGLVKDWDVMREIWKHCFKEIKMDSKECYVLMTGSAHSPANREKITQVFFEEFQVPALYLKDPGSLVLYSQDKSSGLVLDVGDTRITCTPFYEGYKITEAESTIDLGGRDITELLGKALIDNLRDEVAARDIVNDLKEKVCYIALDYDEEIKTASNTTNHQNEIRYSTKDENSFLIKNERFQCAEVLFNPSLYQKPTLPGIHQLVDKSMSKCEIDTRRALYGNIIIAGGTSLFPGFTDRLKKELCLLAPATVDINLEAPLNRKHSAWLGGSKFASLISLHNQWITKQEYEDYGGSIVNKKCS